MGFYTLYLRGVMQNWAVCFVSWVVDLIRTWIKQGF